MNSREREELLNEIFDKVFFEKPRRNKMGITLLDLILILIAIGIGSTTSLHWAFAMAISIVVSASIKVFLNNNK